MKAGFISLGCNKNLVDTEVMLGIIKDNGIEIVNDPVVVHVISPLQQNVRCRLPLHLTF